MITKNFPNGFTSWQETHYEVVEKISMISQMDEALIPPLVSFVYTMGGRGGLYELAEELTDEFEELNKNREWDGEFFDEIETFLNDKLNPKPTTEHDNSKPKRRKSK